MPSTQADMEQLLLAYLAVGVRTTADIQKRFSCSQPTVSRLLARCGDHVFPIGKARSTRYTRLRDLRGLGGEFPVYKIDANGNAHSIGTVFAVAHDEYFWRPVSGEETMFRSLPWFLADLRPEGFVGRAFVRQLHHDLGLP